MPRHHSTLQTVSKSRSSSPLPASSSSELSPSALSTPRYPVKSSLLILEKAIDALPVSGLKAAVASLLEIVKTIDKAKQNRDGLQDLVAHLRSLEDKIIRPILAQQHLGIQSTPEPRLDRLTNELYTLASDWQNLKTAHVFTHRFFQYEDYTLGVSDMSRRIKASLATFLQENQNSGVAITQNIQLSVVHGEKHLLSKKIQALPRANAAYDSFSRNNAPTCFEGTREGVLKDCQQWFTTGSTFMYVLLGIAGVGKSTISQTIATLIYQKGRLAASFFFSRYENDRSNSRIFFPTLAFQLAQQNEDFATRINNALEASPDAAQETLPQQLQKLIIEPLKGLPSSTLPMLIVLDALDECDEKGAADILRLLLTQLVTIPFIKIFITTRPEHHLTRILEHAEARNVLVLHEVEASVVSEDIRRFLMYALSVEEVEKVLPYCGWVCEPEDIDALVRSAGRLFIVASLSEKFIKDERQRNPRRQLKLLLGRAERTEGTKRSPFTGLDQLYLQVLESAIPADEHDEHDVERFQNVVGSIITLQDPLSSNSLAQLLEMDIIDVKAVLHLLQSIIVHTDEDPQPRIYHPSFPDFITDSNRCNQARFLVNPSLHHARLAGLCLELMDRQLKRNICRLKITDQYMKNEDIPELEAKVNAYIPPELVYACSFWAIHLSKCLPHGLDLLERLYRFAFKHFLFWMEVLSLSGRIETAYHAMRHAQKFAAYHEAPPELLTMLNDAHRFIIASQEIVRLSALHVYYSALPFSPSETLIWQMYENEAESSMRVLGGREREWNPLLASLGGHSSFITSIALSPDGTRLVSGSHDHTVRIWDAVTGTSLFKLEGHSARVNSVVLSPDGNRIASASDDRTVQLSDTTTGAPLFTLNGHSDAVRSVAFSPDGACLASGSFDHTVRLWDAATGASLFRLRGHSSWITSVVFSYGGSCLASASDDRTVRLWDTVTGELLFKLDGHSEPVSSVAFSSYDTYLASASYDKTVRIWNVSTGALLFKLEGHSEMVRSVVFSPSRSCLASTSNDCTIRLWNPATGAPLFKLEGHSALVTSSVFSPDGDRLASGSSDKTVRLWDAVTGTLLFKFEGHTDSVKSVLFSPSGDYLASASLDMTVRLWDVTTGASSFPLEGHTSTIDSIMLSPDANRLASTSDDKTVRLWDVATGVSLFKLEGHTSSVNSASFSPDGSYLASASYDTTVRLWDAATGEPLFMLEGHTQSVNSAVFSPNGNYLASASYDGTIRLWDVATGTTLFKLEGHSDLVGSIVFTPDGNRLASGSYDHTIRLWDVATGALLFKLEGHSDLVRSVMFSPNGTRLASTSNDNTIRLWDVVTGASLCRLEGHSGSVRLFAFSPDGNRLVSGSFDKTVRLWDTRSGVTIAQYQGALDLMLDGRAYISQPHSLCQLSWYPDAIPQPTIQANLSGLTHTTRPSGLLPEFLTLLLDDKTQLYAVCAPVGKEAARSTLCWLPSGFIHTRHAWNGKVMSVGLRGGSIIFLDPLAMKLE